MKLFLQLDIMNLYHSEEEISQSVLNFEVPKEIFFYSDLKVLQSICNLTVTVFYDISLYEHFIYMQNKLSYKTKSILW